MTELKLRALIAEDELAARQALEELLKNDNEIDVCALCGDGKEATEQIIRLKPDLVFLDIQMPEMNGFEVLEAIRDENLPLFIFVTAYDEYAIKAFEKSAIDYLLKPFSDSRFYQSLEKAKKAVISKKFHTQVDQVAGLLQVLQAAPSANPASFIKRFTIKSNGTISFIPLEQVYYIESEGNFVKLYTEVNFKIASYTFKSLSEILNPLQFLRIHKSFMVNIDHIERLEACSHGDYMVYLTNKACLRMSRNYNDCLKKISGF